MLNISAISCHTTTGRSNSFDISDLHSSPRRQLFKNAMKSSSISTALDIKSATTMPFKEDLHAKLAYMTAEVDRLTYANSELTAEIDDWKKHFREAEKLIGKNATITINRTVVDDQASQRCRELEHQVTELSARLEQSYRIPRVATQTNETFEMTLNEAETWKEKYTNMERIYLKEIESLKSRLNTAVFESNHKRQGTEMTPKAKGDTIRTPRFAKDSFRPLISESSPSVRDTFQQHYQAVPFQLRLSHIEEKIPSENFDESSEMAEPIYMKALVFEDSAEKKRFDLSIVEAIKGDDAISFDQSFTEVSESLNRLNKTLEDAETCIERLPKDNENECCKNRRTELEKLKEEVRKLRRDVSGYEVVARVLSKKAQETMSIKKEKEYLEQELNICKQKLSENEKRLVQPTSQEVFNVQDYESKLRALNESPRRVLEMTKQQIELQNEKECLTLQLNVAQDMMKTAFQKGEDLQSEINRLNKIIEENKSTLQICEQEKSQLQVRIVEFEKTVETLNIEIGAWKEEYNKLDNRTKQHRRAGSDSLTSDLKIKFEENERRVSELLKENNNLNEMIKLKSLELDELRRIHKAIMDGHKEEMNKKWLKSCVQMEEIALSLESRKNNMQAQLEKMQEIVGTNTKELEGLYEQNEVIRQENQFLLEEIRKLKVKEEQYQTLLHGLKERL